MLFVTMSSGRARADDGELDRTSFFALGFGLAHASDVGDELAHVGHDITLYFGQPLRRGVHLVEELVARTGETETLATGEPIAQSQGRFGVGLRWVPFDARRIAIRRAPPFGVSFMDFSFLAVRATAGVAIKGTKPFQPMSEEQVSYGPAAALTMTWLPMQGADYAWGLEVSGQLARFRGDLQRTLAFHLVVQLGR